MNSFREPAPKKQKLLSPEQLEVKTGSLRERVDRVEITQRIAESRRHSDGYNGHDESMSLAFFLPVVLPAVTFGALYFLGLSAIQATIGAVVAALLAFAYLIESVRKKNDT